MKAILKFFVALGVALSTVSVAIAQDWPKKPIHWMIPITAGNVNDLSARIVADKLGSMYGQRVVVENFAGAGGVLGVQKFLRSENDGYTFGFLPGSTVMITPLLYKDAGYDPLKDFVPVAPVMEVPYLVTVNPALGVKTLADLVKMAKAQPGKLKFASQFIGSGAHLTAERFFAAAGIKVSVIPYRGVTEAVTSVVSGETQFTLQAVSTMADLVKANQLIALGVTSKTRLSALPDVPTTSETIAGSDGTAWCGVFALNGTPKEIVEKLARDIDAVLAMPDVIQRFEAAGIYPVRGRQKELAEKVNVESPIFRKIVADANIKIQ